MAIITVEDLRKHLSISGVQHDAALTNAVNAANSWVANWCGRDFMRVEDGAETVRVFNPSDSTLTYIDDIWSTTNLVVKSDDGDDGTFETTWASTDYQLEPINQREYGAMVPYYMIRAIGDRSFPIRSVRPSLQITAAWGWSAPPGDVFEATLLKAAQLFHRKDSPQGVAGFDQFGAVRISKAEDPQVVSLLAPYRRDVALVA